MNNLKKAALNITSKFGLLNPHRTLVLAISEGREVHETLLKLVLARVNASTSLLKWAKKEENHSLKESVCRLYDISLMYASVQREFAEQSNALNNSLKDILSHEVALEALRKRLKDVTDKKEKLEKAATDVRKKSIVVTTPTDEIVKLKEEEENLKTDLEVKLLQAELFKSSSIKSSLKMVCDAQLKYAEKLSLIFTAANKVIDTIKDVPDHLKPKAPHKQRVSNVVEKPDPLVELSKALNINRPISSNMGNPSSIFHVDLGQSNVKTNHIKMLQKAELKKTISSPVLLSPPPRPSQSIVSIESIVSSNTPSLVVAPQPVASGHRGRSKTSEVFWSHIYASGDDVVPKRYSTVNEYDEVGNVDLKGTDSFGRLYRSASDSTISSSKTNEMYSEPWEDFDVECELIHKRKLHSLSEPTEYDSCYRDPIDKFDVKTHISKHQEHRSEQIYCQPVALTNDSNDLPSERYENTANVMNTVEYMDHQFMREPLRSKLDILENILLTKSAPTPAPKPKPKFDVHQRKMHSSVRLLESPKQVPPRPKPRPSTVLYESPSSLSVSKETEFSDVMADQQKRGSVREIAAHMSTKIQPASLIPSMTQAKLREKENSDYQNI